METPEQPQSTRTTMQHRSYQPLHPAVNKYLQQIWDKASYDLHKKKVKSSKPVINTSPPKTYGHLALKLKKQKLDEDWTMKIGRENNMLMEKISHIMRTTGVVDNKNYYDRKSLNENKRQQELLRITKENEMILFRLSQCRSHYNVKNWQKDWVKTLKMMDSITRYPKEEANHQRGKNQRKEILSKTSNSCNQAQMLSCDANNKTNGKEKCGENEKKREANKTQDTAPEIMKDAAPQPSAEPNVPANPTSPEKPENNSSSDTIKITTKEHGHSNE